MTLESSDDFGTFKLAIAPSFYALKASTNLKSAKGSVLEALIEKKNVIPSKRYDC